MWLFRLVPTFSLCMDLPGHNIGHTKEFRPKIPMILGLSSFPMNVVQILRQTIGSLLVLDVVTTSEDR